MYLQEKDNLVVIREYLKKVDRCGRLFCSRLKAATKCGNHLADGRLDKIATKLEEE